jgi:hypothetical protein
MAQRFVVLTFVQLLNDIFAPPAPELTQLTATWKVAKAAVAAAFLDCTGGTGWLMMGVSSGTS